MNNQLTQAIELLEKCNQPHHREWLSPEDAETVLTALKATRTPSAAAGEVPEGPYVLLSDTVEGTHPQYGVGRFFTEDAVQTAAPQPPAAAEAGDAEEDAWLIDRLSKLLAGVAVALKGPEEALKRHGYQDLPELAEKMALELAIFREREASPTSSRAQAAGVELPKVCDGKEQDEFEAWARTENFDMTTHPLHWLFLNERTSAARNGWKAALEYVNRAALAAPAPAQAAGVDIPTWQQRCDWQSSEPATKLMVEAMKAEIAELRAALAATPSEEADLRASLKQLNDSTHRERERLMAHIHRLETALWKFGAPGEEALQAARKGIATPSEGVGADDGWLLPDDLAALQRFHECATDFDSGGHDVPKAQVARLVEIGVLRSIGFGRHMVTSFGDYVLGQASASHAEFRKPLKTLAEYNADAALAAAQPTTEGGE